jgi:hypothetical protein
MAIDHSITIFLSSLRYAFSSIDFHNAKNISAVRKAFESTFMLHSTGPRVDALNSHDNGNKVDIASRELGRQQQLTGTADSSALYTATKRLICYAYCIRCSTHAIDSFIGDFSDGTFNLIETRSRSE